VYSQAEQREIIYRKSSSHPLLTSIVIFRILQSEKPTEGGRSQIIFSPCCGCRRQRKRLAAGRTCQFQPESLTTTLGLAATLRRVPSQKFMCKQLTLFSLPLHFHQELQSQTSQQLKTPSNPSSDTRALSYPVSPQSKSQHQAHGIPKQSHFLQLLIKSLSYHKHVER
jgi:hypothetical protein